MFPVTKAVLTHLTEGTAIINVTSVTAYWAACTRSTTPTKGAIVAFTRLVADNL